VPVLKEIGRLAHFILSAAILVAGYCTPRGLRQVTPPNNRAGDPVIGTIFWTSRGGGRLSVTSLFARKAKIAFLPTKMSRLGYWDVVLGTSGARLFGHCSVGGHCSVILGGGLPPTRPQRKVLCGTHRLSHQHPFATIAAALRPCFFWEFAALTKSITPQVTVVLEITAGMYCGKKAARQEASGERVLLSGIGPPHLAGKWHERLGVVVVAVFFSYFQKILFGITPWAWGVSCPPWVGQCVSVLHSPRPEFKKEPGPKIVRGESGRLGMMLSFGFPTLQPKGGGLTSRHLFPKHASHSRMLAAFVSPRNPRSTLRSGPASHPPTPLLRTLAGQPHGQMRVRKTGGRGGAQEKDWGRGWHLSVPPLWSLSDICTSRRKKLYKQYIP